MKIIKYFYVTAAIHFTLIYLSFFFSSYPEFFIDSYGLISGYNLFCMIFIISCLRKRTIKYAKIGLKTSNILSTILILCAIYLVYDLKEVEQKIFHKPTNIISLSGELKNVDDYNFSYNQRGIATPRDPNTDRGRALPISYFNKIDIETSENSLRIMTTCSITNYGNCRNEIGKEIHESTYLYLEKNNQFGKVKINRINYSNKTINLIYYLSINNQVLDQNFFINLYRK